ncbi:MAG: hypothetical protein NWE94_04685 [Candidatus Bathyarchaeota archaeon]|nr:hypothetical protein [Candidatus Bathyarchaeota archaeon]
MRKRFLIATIAIIAVLTIAVAFLVNQELISKHMYPQDALHEDSNLTVRGIVTSIEENYKAWGWEYHIYRFYIQLNITEIVWIREDLSDWIEYSADKNTIKGWNSIGVGYDNLDNPQLIIGQIVECKGHYIPVTDLPGSFKITIAPSVNDSYLKSQI